MSLPNPAFEEATYLLTRRCVQREFWLKPTPTVTKLFRYAVARAAERHEVAVHAAVVLTNHWHAVITVSEAVASEFARDVHAAVARGLNQCLDRCEALWSSDGLSLVRLVDPAAIFEKMVYTEVNVVAAGLVRSPEEWGGFRATPRDALRKPRRFRRPRTFYRRGEAATCPEEVELRVTVPECFADEGDLVFVERFEEAVNRRVRELEAEAEASGDSFLGMAGVLAQRCRDRPRTEERRRGRRPRIACVDPVLRRQALGELSAFRTEYRAAREAWLEHEQRVPFPYGTHIMRPYPNVVVAKPPDQAGAAA